MTASTGREVIPRSAWRRSRWRNGAGWGAEIVAEPRSASDPALPFEWRLAIAEIESDAPFSDYPGIERIITLMEGPGFELDIEGHAGVSAREAGVPHLFPGDRPTRCRLHAGPVRVLNLMASRASWQADVTVGPPGRIAPGADGVATIAFVLRGEAHLGSMLLALHDTALVTGPGEPLAFAGSPEALVFVARLRSVPLPGRSRGSAQPWP